MFDKKQSKLYNSIHKKEGEIMDRQKEFLIESLISQYGMNIADTIIEEGYQKTKKTTFRTNTSKTENSKIKEVLKNNNISYQEVSWYKDAFILDNETEKTISRLQLYQNGEIYLQNLSSMIPPFVLNPKENESILDMTASPGSKTTQMANLSNGKALITAVEKNKIRAERLKYNVEHQGAKRVNIMIEDARRLNDFFQFDKVLLDAPCSGSGTLNFQDEKAFANFSESLVENSAKIQKELLKKAIKLTKVGGEIIYSTCSILQEENENVIEEVLKSNLVEIVPISNELKDNLPTLKTKIDGVLCIRPTQIYEGFFVAKLKKIKK